MPTYVYKFIDTDETIEVQQAFSDDALIEALHPTRGEMMKVKKVFLPVGVTFKGGGFYKTDNRGGSGKSASTAPASTSSSSGDSGSSSSGDSGSSAAAPAAAPSSTPTASSSSSD